MPPKSTPKPPRLTKKSPAVMLLRSKLESGELSGTEEPRFVRDSDSAFKQYSLNAFRTCYNNLRKELFNGKFIFYLMHGFCCACPET